MDETGDLARPADGGSAMGLSSDLPGPFDDQDNQDFGQRLLSSDDPLVPDLGAEVMQRFLDRAWLSDEAEADGALVPEPFDPIEAGPGVAALLDKDGWPDAAHEQEDPLVSPVDDSGGDLEGTPAVPDHDRADEANLQWPVGAGEADSEVAE